MKKYLFIFFGEPGSGKSTLQEKIIPKLYPNAAPKKISIDEMIENNIEYKKEIAAARDNYIAIYNKYRKKLNVEAAAT